MKCKSCGIEMSVDRRIEKDDSETFIYKCRNPACSKYGYKKPDTKTDDTNTSQKEGD